MPMLDPPELGDKIRAALPIQVAFLDIVLSTFRIHQHLQFKRRILLQSILTWFNNVLTKLGDFN
eukprot:scaffold23619_cov38-Prasinocladus_malaysianus.AAC.1